MLEKNNKEKSKVESWCLLLRKSPKCLSTILNTRYYFCLKAWPNLALLLFHSSPHQIPQSLLCFPLSPLTLFRAKAIYSITFLLVFHLSDTGCHDFLIRFHNLYWVFSLENNSLKFEGDAQKRVSQYYATFCSSNPHKEMSSGNQFDLESWCTLCWNLPQQIPNQPCQNTTIFWVIHYTNLQQAIYGSQLLLKRL